MHATPRMAQLAIDTAQVPIFWIGADACVLYANYAACRSLGYTREELLSMSVSDFDPDWPREYWDSLGWERLKGPEFSRFESRHRRKDGTCFPVEVFASHVDVEGKEIIFGIVTDISARERVEAALAEKQEGLRRERDRAQGYLDLAGVMFVAIAVDETVTMVNRKSCEVLGYSQDALVGRNWFDICLPEAVRGQVRETFNKLVRGEIEPVEYFENPVLTKSGEERVISWHNTVLRDQEATIIGTLSSGADITDRKRAEDKLRYHLDFENLIAGISTRFISLPSRTIDAEIEKTLELIGRFCGVDYTSVFLFSPDKKIARQTSNWSRGPEFANIKRVESIEMDSFPWESKLTLSGRTLLVSSLDALPEEAIATRALYESLGIKSGVNVPMVAAGGVIGVIGFSCIRERRDWSDDEVRLLEMVGQIISNALERKRVEEELRRAVGEVAQLTEQLQAENVYLREEARKSHGFEGLVGESYAFLDVLRKVEQVSPTDASVLLLGETGTGKELVADAIHSRSPRAGRPLVKVNCAALPGTLIESELFGHEKGAFTGAMTRREGRFELADGGTIFLDEIGDLPLELQAKLLRVLQDGKFERLGSVRTFSVDVRVIAASNRDLERAVEAGTFRADLYYRLGVFPIALPPLRERRKDIPLLVWHCIAQCQERLGKRIDKVTQEAMDALIVYDWPGNVRELQNVIERAAILSPGPSLSIEKWFAGAGKTGEEAPRSSRLEDFERSHILRVIEDCDWKIRGTGNAADRLGMNPSTLRSRMKKLGVVRPAT